MTQNFIFEDLKEKKVKSKQQKKDEISVESLEQEPCLKILFSNLGPESPIESPASTTKKNSKAYSGDYCGTFSIENFADASGLYHTHEDARGWLTNFENYNFRFLDKDVQIWAYYEEYDNWQDTYGMDAVMAVYHSGHGGMTNDGRFYAPLGKDWNGLGTTAWSDKMSLGNEQVRYIFWSTCYSCRVSPPHNPMRTWNTANQGFRMLFGYETTSFDHPDYGSAFWSHWKKGKSLSTAFMDASWYNVSHHQSPAVVACGETQDEAKDRLYNERQFSWSSASKNWWYWRWYNAAKSITTLRDSNQKLPEELYIAEFVPVSVNDAHVKKILRTHDLNITAPKEVTASSDGSFYIKEGDQRLSLENDGSYEIQFTLPNIDNLEQILIEKAMDIAWTFLRRHGIGTNNLLLDDVLLSYEGFGTENGSGILKGPYVTETTIQFTQKINGFPILLPNRGSLAITIDNDGKITSLKNFLKEIGNLTDRFKSTPSAPNERVFIDKGYDPKLLLADAWQDKLKNWIIKGRMPLAHKIVPGTFEIGYSVRDNSAILVARNDIEVDCGSGLRKRYVNEVTLLQ